MLLVKGRIELVTNIRWVGGATTGGRAYEASRSSHLATTFKVGALRIRMHKP